MQVVVHMSNDRAMYVPIYLHFLPSYLLIQGSCAKKSQPGPNNQNQPKSQWI